MSNSKTFCSFLYNSLQQWVIEGNRRVTKLQKNIEWYSLSVCSGTGIVILWNCDCGTEFRICSANYTYRFCRILYNNIRTQTALREFSNIYGAKSEQYQRLEVTVLRHDEKKLGACKGKYTCLDLWWKYTPFFIFFNIWHRCMCYQKRLISYEHYENNSHE